MRHHIIRARYAIARAVTRYTGQQVPQRLRPAFLVTTRTPAGRAHVVVETDSYQPQSVFAVAPQLLLLNNITITPVTA